jgi:hypothetical protein
MRGCIGLALFGKTPGQLEFEVIEELCSEVVETADGVREVQNISGESRESGVGSLESSAAGDFSGDGVESGAGGLREGG